MHSVTSRLQARSYCKPDTPSSLAWKQHVGAMRRLLSAVALLGGSSLNQVRWALSRVAWYTACVIFGRRGTVDFLEGTWPELPSYCYGFQRARRREGAVASHLALAARCRHESISFVD